MTSLLSGLQVFGYYGFGTVATLVLTAKGSTSSTPSATSP